MYFNPLFRNRFHFISYLRWPHRSTEPKRLWLPSDSKACSSLPTSVCDPLSISFLIIYHVYCLNAKHYSLRKTKLYASLKMWLLSRTRKWALDKLILRTKEKTQGMQKCSFPKTFLHKTYSQKILSILIYLLVTLCTRVCILH